MLSLPMLSVSARRLHQCRLTMVDREIEQASLFPFFDRQGAIRLVMAVDSGAGESRFAPAGEARLVIGFWKRIEWNQWWSRLQEPDEEIRHAVKDLFHFDPWWILDQSPFCDQKITPILKATNCASSFSSVYFHPKLSKVTWVAIGKKGETSTVRLQSHHLPIRLPAWESNGPIRFGGAECNSPGWRLDPFWTRNRTA